MSTETRYGHCTGCRRWLRVRKKDDRIGEHNHPVSKKSCGGVGEPPIEDVPLTSEDISRVVQDAVRESRGHGLDIVVNQIMVRLRESVGYRLERLEQQHRHLVRENAALLDLVGEE